jgi:hypothetical protein
MSHPRYFVALLSLRMALDMRQLRLCSMFKGEWTKSDRMSLYVVQHRLS